MIPNDTKTSLLIAQQLPEFIRDEQGYQTFVSFLEAYYQWLETAQTANSQITTASSSGEGVTYASKNLSNYSDIDNTLDDFVSYFVSDFLPYIPTDALTDKRKLLKIAKELYRNKGTEKSFKFLFNALYGAEADIYNTGESILKASDGKWIVTKSLKLNTVDTNWLLINNLKVFGETSKSYATVESGGLLGTKTQIFISNIKRLFQSGEFIRVVDNNNLDVYFYEGQIYIQNSGVVIPSLATTLRAKVVGVISSITIDPKNRGKYYKSGDPVVVTGGLNPDVIGPVGATAVVGETTLGSIQSLVVENISNGYRALPYSAISFSGGGGSGAAAKISLVDDTKITHLGLITNNTLGVMANVWIGDNTHAQTYTNFSHAADTNSRLIDALGYITIDVAPIASVSLTNSGGGYISSPIVSVTSLYANDIGNLIDLKTLGILQPINIVNGGSGYLNSDTIQIIGGSGFGAYANLTVNGTGAIVSASYIYSNANTVQTYPRGGLGYSLNNLPTVNVVTSTGTNASLIVPGVMGDGAVISTITDRTGEITTINIINAGEDYVSAPNVSLKVSDVAVTNVYPGNFPEFGYTIYQGPSYNVSTFSATIYSIVKLQTAFPENPPADIYQVRIYDSVGSYDETQQLHFDVTVSNITTQHSLNPEKYYLDVNNTPTSIVRYGDGNAKATASFLDGLIVSRGTYLNNDGQISSLGLVLESVNYNGFTYVLSAEKAVATYRDIVKNLLHPSGMRMVPVNLLKANSNFIMQTSETLGSGLPLGSIAGVNAWAIIGNTQSHAISTNIIQFTGGISINIGNTIKINDWVEYTATNNLKSYSTVDKVDYVNNKIYTTDNVFYGFANVAIGDITASSNVINITSVTGQYDGNFNTPSLANTFISIGDQLSLNGGPFTAVTKVFSNGNMSVANSSIGPINNALLTLNKSANTNTVMFYRLNN